MTTTVTPTAPSPTAEPHVVATGYAGWIDRAVSLSVLGAGLASLGLAYRQLGSIDWRWLAVVGGGILATSLLLPVYAWSSRGVRVPATLFAANVLCGLWTWPFSWLGVPSPEPPFLWMVIGVSTVVLAIAWGNTIAVMHNLFSSAAYLMARVSPSGGGVSALVALQDTFVVALQPLGLLVLFTYLRRQAAELDSWVAASRRLEADAALRTTLVGERTRLDGVIHDEVMTTLVSAGRGSGSHDDHLAEQARHALASLEAEAAEDTGEDAFPPANVGRLIDDVVGAACPMATVTTAIDPLAPLVPHRVVRMLARAVREAAINAERHAQARHVGVHVTIAPTETGQVSCKVTVADDGRGFDVSAVNARRLGIRVSLRKRVESVGGTAEIESAPGRGTTVTVAWSGFPDEVRRDTRGSSTRDHPMFDRVDVRPIGWLALGAIVLFTGVGVLEAFVAPRPGLTLAAVAVVAFVAPLTLVDFGRELPAWRAWSATVGAVAIGMLGALSLPDAGHWTAHSDWWVALLCVFTILIRAAGHEVAAWTCAVASAVIVLVGTMASGQPLVGLIAPALNPIGWLAVVELLVVWIGRIQADLDAAQRAAEEASTQSAASFGKLVLREVWLADLRDQVDPLLLKIADPDAALTPADREDCLALEGTLRDGIKAANLTGPSLSAAIMEARRRGVQVTLVDNRGSALPDRARRAALRHLEAVVRGATEGRIVARTAPEGYDDAVTIVQVNSDGSRLARIDDEGMISVSHA